MISVFLADGFEEVEALAPIDILRRLGLQVQLVSVMPTRTVKSSHHVEVHADVCFEEANFSQNDALILPGGMPGAANLQAHKGLASLLFNQAREEGLIDAICAAPMVLGGLGLLEGKRATCYPGFEAHLEGAIYTAAQVEEDANFITANGPGAAFAFSYAIAKRFVPDEAVNALQKAMMFNA